MKRLIYLLFLVSLSVFIFPSCHQRGCTNRDAVNFNVTADEDDGSCIVCNDDSSLMDTEIVNLKDKNFGSPYYNQIVAKFYLDQYLFTPNDKACGKEKSKLMLKMESLINKNMYVVYQIRTFSGPLNVFYSNDITINAYESIDIGLVQSFINPPFLSISLDSLYSQTQADIIYF